MVIPRKLKLSINSMLEPAIVRRGLWICLIDWLVQSEHNITGNIQWMYFLIEAMVKHSRLLQAFAHRSALARSKSIPSCNTEQAYSIEMHACVQKLAESTTRKAFTIDPSRQCLSARRRGFPRTKTRLIYIVNRTVGEQSYWVFAK